MRREARTSLESCSAKAPRRCDPPVVDAPPTSVRGSPSSGSLACGAATLLDAGKNVAAAPTSKVDHASAVVKPSHARRLRLAHVAGSPGLIDASARERRRGQRDAESIRGARRPGPTGSAGRSRRAWASFSATRVLASMRSIGRTMAFLPCASRSTCSAMRNFSLALEDVTGRRETSKNEVPQLDPDWIRLVMNHGVPGLVGDGAQAARASDSPRGRRVAEGTGHRRPTCMRHCEVADAPPASRSASAPPPPSSSRAERRRLGTKRRAAQSQRDVLGAASEAGFGVIAGRTPSVRRRRALSGTWRAMAPRRGARPRRSCAVEAVYRSLPLERAQDGVRLRHVDGSVGGGGEGASAFRTAMSLKAVVARR